MSHPSARRARAASFASAGVLAAVFAIPATASAEVTSTSVATPLEGTVFDSDFAFFGFPGGANPDPILVTGTAPGAADGDEVRIGCTYSLNGVLAVEPLLGEDTAIQDGAFSASVYPPTYTCRIRALPDGFDYSQPADTDVSSFTGPRVLGGGVQVEDDADDAPPYDGAQLFASGRGQSQGYVFSSSLSTSAFFGGLNGLGGGGISASALIDDTYYRLLFGPSAALGGFGSFAGGPSTVDADNAGLLIDGAAAVPVPGVGEERSKLVSKTTNLQNGDLTIVETAPVALVPPSDADADGDGDGRPTPSGITIERTTVQDHDGRQITVRDVFRSTDGAAHRVEARYGESVYQDFYGGEEDEITKEPASFRVPWSTGDAYVVPGEGQTFGAAPAGPATIYVHGPRQDFSQPATRARAAARADDELLPRAEGAYTFDSPPTDGRFLSRAAFVVRFVRDVPAGGTGSVGHTYSQDLTPEGLGGLVTDATGGPPSTPPAAPLPATTPLPNAPAPVAPAPILPRPLDPIPLIKKATQRILLTAAQGRRLRDRKSVVVTTKGLPAGRYGITIRRRVAGGRTIASGVKTIKKAGTLNVTVRPTTYGKRYLAGRRTAVEVRVIVTWTPPGKGRRRQQTHYTTKFR